MAKTKKQKTTERRRSSARETAAKDSFERTAVRLPEGVEAFRPKKGVHRFDIIPYVVKAKSNPNAAKGMEHYERTFYQHRNVGPDNKVVICLLKTFNKPCPICEQRTKMANEGDVDKDVIRSMKWSKRQLFNIIDKAEPDKGIQVFDVSYFAFGAQLKEVIENADPEDAENYDHFHYPEAGMTVKAVAADTSMGEGGAAFLKYTTIEFKERKKQYPEKIVNEAHDLDSLLIEMDYKTLKNMFLQTGDDDDDDQDDDDDKDLDEDEDEDELPKSKKKKSKSHEDDDDEGEDEDSDDEDEDDDPPPKKKSNKKKSKKDEEEDDEIDLDDDEDSDEEEEEPPKSKSKKTSSKAASKSKSKKAGKKKPADDDDDDDEDDDDSDDEDDEDDD